jgi:hypothetical protein
VECLLFILDALHCLVADPTVAFLDEAVAHGAAFFVLVTGPFLDGSAASVATFLGAYLFGPVNCTFLRATGAGLVDALEDDCLIVTQDCRRYFAGWPWCFLAGAEFAVHADAIFLSFLSSWY